jgi:hypothetical protein
VQKFAREHTKEALEKLVELIHANNPCVSVAAIRILLERGHGRVPPALPERAKQEDSKGVVNVTITRYNDGIIYDKRNRDHELPVVYGGWQGPRDLGDVGDTGLSTLSGQRTGVRDEPGIHDRPAAGLQRTGTGRSTEGGRSGGAPATRTNGSPAKTQRRRGKK